MDAIDLRILEMLQADGRASHSDIAKAVGLSAPSIGERIRKLESSGIIRRYACVLEPKRIGRTVAALIAVTLDKPIHEKAFVQRMQELNDVLECYHVTGDMDYMLKVRTRSTETLEALIANDIRPLDGVVTTKTMLVLSAAKEETRIKLSSEDLTV
jgi:Lrp/AsnC family leucine-responsive transcriptional regulator